MMGQRHVGIGMTSQRTRERLIQRLREQGIADSRVLEAVRKVPRHLFVDEALATRAYEDTALPIGDGQTISQPYMVARMTELLLMGGDRRKVLEIGTGSGYQTAVLAQLVPEIYSVERVGRLLARARNLLRELGAGSVRFRHGDGNEGWAENASYDGILVTAAPVDLPPALVAQLAEGGRLVIPVGERGAQRLMVVDRHGEVCQQETLDMVSFVPLRDGAQ